MHIMIRRARGVLGMAAMWGAAFGMVGAGYALWQFHYRVTRIVMDGRDITPAWWLVAARGANIVAPWGVLGGVCFALGLIALARSRTGWRTADALPTTGRGAAWGAFAATMVPLAAAAAAALGMLHGTAIHYGLPIRLVGAAAVAGGAVAAAVISIGRRSPVAQLGGARAVSLPRDV